MKTNVPTTPAAEFQPPDGGWGWMIIIASSVGNVVVIPIIQNFGLIFRDRFAVLNMSATDVAIIININASFGMLMGLVNGSLLKKFGYRKISVLGGALTASGVIITAYVTTFEGILIAYGLITSLGFGMTIASYSLAVNTYFRKRRAFALGLATTGMGVGSVFMPLLMSLLLQHYGPQGSMLIIGAMSMHCFIASCLLQPVKWHVKLVIPEIEAGKLVRTSECNEENVTNSNTNGLKKGTSVYDSAFSVNYDGESVSLYETPLPRKKHSIASITDRDKLRAQIIQRSISVQDHPKKENGTYHAIHLQNSNSKKSVDTEDEEDKKLENTKLNNNTEEEAEPKKRNPILQILKHIIDFMDVDLLKDPEYISLMLGMSIAICAELNFSLLTPFILDDYGYNTQETAQVIACIAFADIIFRFLAPFVSNRVKWSIKMMYAISLTMLIIGRTAIMFTATFTQIMVVAVGLGVAKGFRTVYMSLLIPTYVPLEKLANASGMQMMANGVIILLGGPILGFIRDVTGSYNKSILAINFITFITIFMWTTHGIYVKCFKKRR